MRSLIRLFHLLVLSAFLGAGCGEGDAAAGAGGSVGSAGMRGQGGFGGNMEERPPVSQPALWDFLDSQQSIRSSHDLLAQRAEVVELVFGGPMPTRLPDAVEAITDGHYPGLAVDRLTIHTDDLSSIVYLIHPSTWTGGLALYHQGHRGDFRIHGEDTILGLLQAGHQVLAFSMPMLGMNTHPYVDRRHGRLADRDHPLGAFAEPVVVALNWAEASYSYSRRFMVGISGGGWTTVLVAALDDRIDASYPVAGSWPHYLTEIYGSQGCYEGRITPNYLELYLMATYPGRQQVQGFNVYDPCCFGGLVAYEYLAYVSYHAWRLGGRFDMLMDLSHEEHMISPDMLAAFLHLERLAMEVD